MRTPTLRAFLLSLFLTFTLATSQLIRMPITKDPKLQSPSQSGFLGFNSKTMSMDIQNFMNSQYSGTIKIGSSGTSFKVILDTGSANLWVPDSSLVDQYYNGYDCSSSSTCKAFPYSQYPLIYGKGAIVGYKAVDQLQLGGLSIPEFQMLLASDIQDMPPGNFDGILGLSLGRHLPEFPTVLEVLKKQGLISTGTFSMYLGDDPRSYGGATGEIIFGGYDPKYALSEFKFVEVHNVRRTLFWAADMKAVSYGYKQNMTNIAEFPAIFDSGTSLLMLPQTVIDNLLFQAADSHISCNYDSNSEMYACDCLAQNILEDLVFYFKGATLSVPASAYLINNGGKCFLGIQPQKGRISLDNPAILGDVLLKNYYTLYTADNSTVGFAQALPVKHFPIWLILLIILAVSMAIALAIYLYNRRKQKVNPSPSSSSILPSTGSYFQSFKGKGVVIGSDYAEMMSPPLENNRRLMQADSLEVRAYPPVVSS